MYKYFMITPVSHLPVADEEGNLVGLLSKNKLLMEMADLSMSDREYETIPAEFMVGELSEDILNFFQKQRLIPVLGLNAEKMDYWDKPRFLAEISRLTQPEPAAVKEINEDAPEKKSSAIHWYIELVLQNFPDAMFATDIDGNTIFYNEKFEKNILTRPLFRNSIQFAERYLRDMNRDLFAAFLKNGEIEEADVITTWFKNLNMNLRVITLKDNTKMAGFLYHFIDPDAGRMNESGKKFPSVADAYSSSFPLEKIIEDVEKSYIESALKDNDNNISHSAEKLGIPRTTLQNRMRQLKIRIESEIPVPRKRVAAGKKNPPKARVQAKETKVVKKPVKPRIVPKTAKKKSKQAVKPTKPVKTPKKR